ncbi:MAG: group 1 truncated hemoglobin [Ectothiorhodospiraceae bacterium]|nr:group 1 truncated hemoglobin [Ectothiorhodospiraceae bacterium]
METITQVSLYERLGSANGIKMLVDDVVEAHMQNPNVSARFLPYRDQPELLEKIKQHTCEFFAMGAGGPEVYSGRDMVSTHQGMNISEEEYMHVIDDILMVLGKHGMDDQTQKDVLAILWSLKGEIMHK